MNVTRTFGPSFIRLKSVQRVSNDKSTEAVLFLPRNPRHADVLSRLLAERFTQPLLRFVISSRVHDKASSGNCGIITLHGDGHLQYLSFHGDSHCRNRHLSPSSATVAPLQPPPLGPRHIHAKGGRAFFWELNNERPGPLRTESRGR